MHTYSADEVIVTFGPVILSGFADGTFISVEQNEDAFTLMVGADGDSCRAKSNNRSGRMTATLLQSSAVNDLLSAIYNVDINSPSGDGINPLLVKDNTGRTLHAAEKAWITKIPNTTFARETESREWVFETDNMQFFLGGN
jgi:hypothetical protein